MLTRRTFLTGVSVAAVASRLSADQAKFPKGRYFDMHTHLGQTWNSTQVLTAEVLLRWMDAHNIAQAVVLPLINPEASSYPLTPRFVLSETKPYRDRLIPFCSIDPRTSYRGGHKLNSLVLQKLMSDKSAFEFVGSPISKSRVHHGELVAVNAPAYAANLL